VRVPLACWKCSDEEANEFIMREYNDTGKYFHTCKNGHESVLLLENHRFELLFDLGMHAIKRGFYREGIANFTSSLERFQEFVIKTLCLKSKVDWGEMAKAWKNIAAQSERQLGAFIFLYLQEFHVQPSLLKNDDVNLRNQVIHKGKIPTQKQSIEFGQKVMEIIRPVIAELKYKYAEFYNEIELRNMNVLKVGISSDTNISTHRVITVLGLNDYRKHIPDYNLQNEIRMIDSRFW